MLDKSIATAFTPKDEKDEELLSAICCHNHCVKNEMLSLQQAGLKKRHAFPISEYARWHDAYIAAGCESFSGDNQDCKSVGRLVGKYRH